VEFALLAPLFFMIVLGMFSGGLAYTRKLAVTSAVREGVRYGATLPVGAGAVPATWFAQIRDRAIFSANGDLNTTWDGEYICVAYVGLLPNSSTSGTSKREWNGNTGPTADASACFDDGRPADERRVQVIGRRNTRFDALLFGSNISLSSQAVARFEAISPAS